MQTYCDVIFLCGSPEECGWRDYGNCSSQIQEAISLVENTSAADLAERLSEYPFLRVSIYQWNSCLEGLDPPLSSLVTVGNLAGDSFHIAVSNAIRDIYVSSPTANVLAFYGRNPLYPVELLLEGIELVGQEDDVIAVGQSTNSHKPSRPIWLSTKRYHPELFGRGDHALLEERLLQLPSVQSLIMPIRAMSDISALSDLPILFHDIEREMLLGNWFPYRTHHVLKRMHRIGLLEGVRQ